MKICPKCDNQNANNAAVCKSCGASLNDVPDLENAVVELEQKDKRPALAFLFALLSFVSAASKELLPIDAEEPAVSHFILYFIACAAAVAFLVFAFLFLRGIFKKRPIPTIGLAAVLLSIVCVVMVGLDLLSLPATISDFRNLL
ncbi:MAG: hypothetical protein J6Y95_01915 [Lachnospiraceae bacterium]|nr:hypothetical protein [Lachnospiraceae bacterium]